MPHPILTRCPICSGELLATRLECGNCHGTIESEFDLGFLKRLSQEQIQLITLLVKNRGNMNRVATDLGVHYNTVRNRMDELAAAMGVPDQPAPAPNQERLSVLEQLGSGALNPEEALAQLRNRKQNQPDQAE